MALTATGYEHIVIDEKGIPIIRGTTTKVLELVVEKQAYGWSPEELHLQHPYLSLGQIYSAFAYYWDHADEIDTEIIQRSAHVAQLRKTGAESSLKARLKARGLL